MVDTSAAERTLPLALEEEDDDVRHLVEETLNQKKQMSLVFATRELQFIFFKCRESSVNLFRYC